MNLPATYQQVKHFLLYLFFAFAFIALYIELSHFWVPIGGFSGVSDFMDIPILFILLILFYIPKSKIRNSLFIALLAIMPLYLLYDLFYYFLKRNPVLSDFQNVTALSDFSPLLLITGLSFLVIGYLPFIFNQINALVKERHYLLFGFKLILLVSLFSLLRSDSFFHTFKKHFHYTGFSLQKTIKDNGRLASFLYYSHKEKEAQTLLHTFFDKPIDINKALFADTRILQKRNIYIVVLESFIDPRLLKDVSYNRSPLYEGMQKYLDHGSFSHTISPVYGGGTSQAEFEIITGVHAFAALNTAEFNVLRGRPTSGFVDFLSKKGYDNLAIIATKSTYYNSPVAYSSLGMKRALFLEEAEDFHLNKNDDRIFDGDLYTYALKKQRQLKPPYLLYALGMYGHLPYKRNTAQRPDIITNSANSKSITNISNQFYYRTKALSQYIDAILKKDKKSVILVSSDHLPPILNKGITYDYGNFTNSSLLLIDGRFIDISGKDYYQFSQIIMEYLTGQKMPKVSEEKMRSLYFKLISESY